LGLVVAVVVDDVVVRVVVVFDVGLAFVAVVVGREGAFPAADLEAGDVVVFEAGAFVAVVAVRGFG
jgi:hypothetical protein